MSCSSQSLCENKLIRFERMPRHLFSSVTQISANNLNVHYFHFNKNDLEFYSMTFMYFMNISALLHINKINGHERFSILPLYHCIFGNVIKFFINYSKNLKTFDDASLNLTAIYAALMEYNVHTTRIRYQILKFFDENIFFIRIFKIFF